MITGKERDVLRVLGQAQLIKKDEIIKALGLTQPDGVAESLIYLRDNGYIESLDAVGSPCFLITQKGLRALR